MICFKCGKQMKNVLHFESGREYQFNSCPCCREHTKKKRLHYEDILQTSENKKGDANEKSKRSATAR